MSEFTIPDSELAKIKDAVVVLTGTSSGIGLATAELILQHGGCVVGSDLVPPPADSSLGQHKKFSFVRCDVTSWSDLHSMFKAAIDTHGHIDHVFANAGIGGADEYFVDSFVDGVLEEPKHASIHINLTSVANTLRLGLHYLQKNPNGGSLVATGSVAGLMHFSLIDYAASKAAVMCLTRSMGLKLASTGSNIRACSLAPHWTNTPLLGETARTRIGSVAQTPVAVGKAAVACMVDTSRNAHCVYVQEGRYFEVDERIRKSIMDMLPTPSPEARTHAQVAAKSVASRWEEQQKEVEGA